MDVFKKLDFTTLQLSKTTNNKKNNELDEKLDAYSITSSVFLVHIINSLYITLMFGVLFSFLYFLMKIFRCITYRFKKCKGRSLLDFIHTSMRSQLVWNYWIRCLMEFVLDMFIISGINIRYPNSVRVSSHLGVSYVISYLFGIILILGVVLIAVKLKKKYKKYNQSVKTSLDDTTENEGGTQEYVMPKQKTWDQNFIELYSAQNTKLRSVVIIVF